MKHPIVRLLMQLGAVFLFLFAYVPLLVLSFFNHPSAADDYCFADTALKHGFWQAQIFYYDGWTGRYFSNFLVHGTPLVWGWYDGFRLIPLLAVTGLLASIYSLLSELLRGQSKQTLILATAILFFISIVSLQSSVEAFFWTAAVASYTVPTALTFYLIAVIIRWYRLRDGFIKSLTVVWAGFLVFAIVGSSETNLIVLVLLLLALGAYRLLFQQKLDWFLGVLIIVSFISSWLLFRAEGNAIRMGGNPHGGEFINSLVSSLGWLGMSLGLWLLKTPVIPLSILYVPLALRLLRPNSPVRYLFQVPAGIVTLVYIGLLGALIFPSYYGIGMPPAFRTMNVFYYFALYGWFYVLTTWVYFANRQSWRVERFTVPVSVPVLMVIWVGAAIWFSQPLKLMYNDLLRGHAATFNREMNERREQLLQPGKEVKLKPLSIQPPSLFVDDIKEDPEYLWNRCQAGYYGHQKLILE